MKKLNKIFRVFIYLLPSVLFLSYHPLLHFGVAESMNLEISLPLVWLVVFDIYAFFLIVKFKQFKEFLKKWVWFAFPIFMTISLLWTYDLFRGVLIGGVLWLIYFAGYSIFNLSKSAFNEVSWKVFFKVFFYTTLFVCFWCVLQSVLDVAGVGREYTLACPGCTYHIFGFPHPNGFAAEPQYMGNLLLAPIVIGIYFLEKKKYFSKKFLLFCLGVFITTLFLTLSRGAIYAFVIGLIIFVITKIIKEKNWQSLSLFVISFLAFLFALNIQGLMSEFSSTDDTYISGVNKVVNQLTLGKIDLGGRQVKKDEPEVENVDEEIKETSIFDGYVEVSTDARTSVWTGALKTWTKDFRTILFGVGLGGGLKGMYVSGNFYSSQESINNEYISVLLEGGIVGILLLVFTIVLFFKFINGLNERLYVFVLCVMYMTTYLFFSGLPNSIHIFLLPVLFVTYCRSLRK